MAGKQYPIINNFSKGELSSRMAGRVDIQGYYNGCKTMKNCIMVAQGGAEKRPGTVFLSETLDSDSETKLIPFEVNDQEIYMLEISHKRMRIWDVLAKVLVIDPEGKGVDYIITPWEDRQISAIQYATKEGQIFFTHSEHPFCSLKVKYGLFTYKRETFNVEEWTAKSYRRRTFVYYEPNREYYIAIKDTDTNHPVENPWSEGFPFTETLSGDFTDYAGGSFMAGDIKIFNGGLYKALRTFTSTVTQANCYPGEEITEIQWGDWGATRTEWIGLWEKKCVARFLGVCIRRETYWDYMVRKFVTPTQEIKDAGWNGDTPIGGWVNYQLRKSSRVSTTSSSTPYWSKVILTFTETSVTDLIEWDAVDAYVKGDVVYNGYKIYTANKAVTGTAPGTAPQWELLSNNPFFSIEGDYPSAVAFMGQRLYLGGTKSHPNTFFGSKVNWYDNFNIGLDDDDAFYFEIASERSSRIKWMSGKDYLTIGTSSSEWLVTGGAVGITPTNVQVLKQSSYGSAYNQAIQVADSLLFYQKGGRRLREYMYSNDNKAYLANDLTFFADHITAPGIDESSYQQNPDSILWNTKVDGGLIGLTYDRLNQIAGWHRHDTQGQFESVTSIDGRAEEDELWFVVRRVLNGSFIRTIEYMAPRLSNADMIFSDSSIKYIAGDIFPITSIDRFSSEFTLQIALTTATETIVNVGVGNILAGTVQKGYLYITQDNGVIRRIEYTSHDSDDEFTIESSDFLGKDASIGNGVTLDYVAISYSGSTGIANDDTVKLFSTNNDNFDFQTFKVESLTQGASTGVFNLQKFDNTFKLDSLDTINTGSFSIAETVITGLDHLLGSTVDILGDGAVFPPQEVVANIDGLGGVGVTLKTACNRVICGLNYKTVLEPMSIELQGTLGAKRRISEVTLKLYNTIGGKIGTDEANLEPLKSRPKTLSFGSAIAPFTGQISVPVDASSEQEASILIVHEQPVPMTIIAIISDISYSRS